MMEKEATSMIEKESADIISGIIVGSSIGVGIWGVLVTCIYYFLL
jgi:F0F1-type ATP synthase assembly protein I